MRYIIGVDDLDIDGYENLSTRTAMNGTRGDLSLIWDGSLGFNTAYKILKRSLEIGNKTAMIIVDTIDNYSRQLCLLMLSKGCYNVYHVDDTEDIDDEYLDMVCERDSTIDEVETFFGPEMAAYPEMSTILNTISSEITKGDLDALTRFIMANSEKIKSMSGLVEYMQKVIEELSLTESSNISTRALDDSGLKRQVDKLREENEKHKDELDISRRAVQDLKVKLTEARNEISTLNDQIADLEQASKASEDTVNLVYTTLELEKYLNNTRMNARVPKVKEVLYFKEISPCKYISTLITMMHNILNEYHGVTTRLLIYDRQSFSNFKYRPLDMVTFKAYIEQRDKIIKKSNKFVVLEPNRVILEDALTDNECLIIYDRLGGADDIVAGKHVHKFYICNSIKDVRALEQEEVIEWSQVIANIGVSRRCISIPDIKDYKHLTPSAKTMAYMNTSNPGENRNLILDILLNDTGVSKLFRK